MIMMITYVYFTICLLIIIYTLSFFMYHKYHHSIQDRTIRRFIRIVHNQLTHMDKKGYINRSHRILLIHRLKKVHLIIAFEKALERIEDGEDQIQLPSYLLQLEPVMIVVATHFRKKDMIEKAFIAKFIAKYSNGQWKAPELYRTLIEYLSHSSVYVRENVLSATYRQPDIGWIVKAFRHITEHHLSHNPKLVQDGLASYPSDKEALADTLWRQRGHFHSSIVVGIIGFITMQSNQYQDEFLHALQHEKMDLELKLRLIRYYKRHPCPEAEALLLSYASDSEDAVRIVAVHVLGSYRSKRVLSVLKRALLDHNWYVRRNASQSLLAIDATASDLSDVLSGHDQFAKDMLSYYYQLEGNV